MKHVPFNLKILDTCLPDYFQGFGGPVISFPVDARMSYMELIARLTDDDAWPSNADIEDIRAAVTDLVGQVHPEASRPYWDIGPDEPSAGFFVSHHPTISNMWLVIDKQDGEVLGSWPTEQEALCEAGDENTPDVYAYFGIELEVPDGYEINSSTHEGWSWDHSTPIGKRGGVASWVDGFDTEMEAKVAAWRHKLSQNVDEWSAGDLDIEPGADLPYAEIDYLGPKDEHHHGRIRIYGSEEEARQLRQRILDFLNGDSQ